LLAEQAQSNQGYQKQIEGAIRQLMGSMKDPAGKIGLDSKEWVAQNDGKGGVKFVTMKIAQSKRRSAAITKSVGKLKPCE